MGTQTGTELERGHRGRETQRDTHTDMNNRDQTPKQDERGTETPDTNGGDANTHTHQVGQRARNPGDRKTMKYKQPP